MQNYDDLPDADTPSSDLHDIISQHCGSFSYAEDFLVPTAETCLVNPHQFARGVPSFTRKKNVDYAVDQSRESVTVPYFRNLCGSRTVQFFSVYADVVPESAEVASPIAVRHERVVRHPVSIGCLKKSGCLLVAPGSTSFSLYWGTRWKEDDYKIIRNQPHCRVNHFTKSFLLGRKDHLSRLIQGASHRFGKVFDVIPKTYLLPADEMRLELEMRGKPTDLFVYKPASSSRGRGICIIQGSSCIPSAAPVEESDQYIDSETSGAVAVVQNYIQRPLTINGFKVDFRLYCLVLSFEPLSVFIYNEGLVRFASEPLQMDTLSVYCHLTNYSVNAANKTFVRATDHDDEGASKWTLHGCKRFFMSHGLDWSTAWNNMCDAVTKTMIAAAPEIATQSNAASHFRFSCFELYGVDVLLDSSLRAFVLEVNILPSLGCATALDKHVKGHLIADTLTLVGVPLDPSRPGNVRCSTMNAETVKSLSDPLFFSTLTDDSMEKLLILESENRLFRRGGFQRTFPTPGPLGAYVTRPCDTLLARWESEKISMRTDEKLEALLWLTGNSKYPRCAKAPPKLLMSAPRRELERIPRRRPNIALENDLSRRAHSGIPQPLTRPRNPRLCTPKSIAPIGIQCFTFSPVKHL